MLALVAVGLFLAGMMQSKPSKPQKKGPVDREAMIRLIREEAARQGVPAPIALAVAEVESEFDPTAAGDRAWADKRPELYQRLVVNNPKLAQNPARLDRKAWHSYGLFQLLAPHFVRGAEHPNVLLDPKVNAQRGIAFIKNLLKRHGDDVSKMRLAYAGATNASAAEQERVLGRFTAAYTRWRDGEAIT